MAINAGIQCGETFDLKWFAQMTYAMTLDFDFTESKGGSDSGDMLKSQPRSAG